jgi:exonuclease III
MLPAFADDRASRYLESEVHGIVIASVYLPNGNPVPSPNFDYKLAWFDHFLAHAADLAASGKPVVLAGDLNVVPTKADIYNEWLWREDAVVQPQTRDRWRKLMDQGWSDATRHRHPDERASPHVRRAHAMRLTEAGDRYLQSGNRSAALSRFRRALRHDPTYTVKTVSAILAREVRARLSPNA